MVLLAAAGALNSVLSLFYYFRIGRAMFLEEAPAGGPGPAPTGPERRSPSVRIFILVAAAVLLLLGVLPDLLTVPAAAARLAG